MKNIRIGENLMVKNISYMEYTRPNEKPKKMHKTFGNRSFVAESLNLLLGGCCIVYN